MKLLEQFKKLKLLNKKRYKITEKYNDFNFHKHKNSTNFLKKDEDITYYTNDKSIISQAEFNGVWEDVYQKKILHVMKKHFFLFIDILLIIIIMFSSSLFIREISFKDNEKYNHEVYEFVSDNLYDFGFAHVLKNNTKDLTKKLKLEFPHYAYIGVTKKFSKLEIDIHEQDEFLHEEKADDVPGDFITKYNGIIKDIKIEKGVVVVNLNQTVKKGDLIVSGNLRYYNNEFNKDFIIKPVGEVIGEIIEIDEYEINKIEDAVILSGNYKDYFYVGINGKSLFNNRISYDNYYTKYLKGPYEYKFISFAKIRYYELINIVNEYTLQNVAKKAYSLKKKEILDNQESLDNLTMNLIYVNETPNSFIVKIATKRRVNLCEFVQYDQN